MNEIMKAFLLVFLTIPLGFSGTALDKVNDDSPEVTDQQEEASKRYIHQGLAQKKTEDMCADGRGGFSDICDEDHYAFDSGGMRTLETLLPALTAAYAMFSSMGPGGKFDAQKTDKAGNLVEPPPNADGSPGEPETTEETDYCGYIAMVSEAAGTAYTALKDENIEANYESAEPEARQAASFYAIADSHKTMAKGAQMQFYSWTATSACYVAYLTQAAYQGDWKVKAKLGASVVIAMYYQKKTDAHKEREKLLIQMAGELPQAGDCNPYTKKSCFCAEETSANSDPSNFRNFCVPRELANRSGKGKDAFVCVDQKGKADAECACVKTNTCIDRKLKIAGVNLGLGSTVMRDPLAALRPISKGFSDAGVNAAAGRNLALARKTLKNLKLKNVPKLNSKQKNIAKGLFKSGLPKAASLVLAKGFKGAGAKLPSSATAGLSGGRLGRFGKNKKAVAAISSRIRKGRSNTKARNKRGNPFSRFGKKRAKNSAGVHIEDWAKKAEREAEIVNDTSKGIFDIISYRYRISAWRQFKENLTSD